MGLPFCHKLAIASHRYVHVPIHINQLLCHIIIIVLLVFMCKILFTIFIKQFLQCVAVSEQYSSTNLELIKASSTMYSIYTTTYNTFFMITVIPISSGAVHWTMSHCYDPWVFTTCFSGGGLL